MDFDKLSSDEIDQFISPYVDELPINRQEKNRLAEQLFNSLSVDELPYPIVDLYIASIYKGSKDKSYIAEEILNLPEKDILKFVNIFGLNPEHNIDLNRQRVLRILNYLELLTSSEEILRTTTVHDRLCEQLSFTDLKNLWYTDQVDLDCWVHIDDKDGKINRLYGLNSDTILTGDMIESLGSKRSWKEANRKGLTQVVKMMVKLGMDPETSYNYQYEIFYPLKDAIIHGDLDLIQFLLEQGADPNRGYSEDEKDHLADTPIGVAIDYKIKPVGIEKEIIRLLVKFGADVTREFDYGETYLLKAITNDKPDIINLLIELGADPSYINRDGKTPVMASLVNRFHITDQLLQLGAELTGEELQELIRIVTKQQWETRDWNLSDDYIVFFLEKGQTIDDFTDLVTISYQRKLTKTRAWLRNHVFQGGDKFNLKTLFELFKLALAHKDVDFVRQLLILGVDPNKEMRFGFLTEYSLRMVTRGNRYSKQHSMIKLLIDFGANPNQSLDGKTPLMNLLSPWPNFEDNNMLESVKLLLDNGADPNAKNEDGKTPLMYFFNQQYPYNLEDRDAVLKLLLDWGADVNAQDNLGSSVLTYLINNKMYWNREDRAYHLDLLLKYGANPHLKVKYVTSVFSRIKNGPGFNDLLPIIKLY